MWVGIANVCAPFSSFTASENKYQLYSVGYCAYSWSEGFSSHWMESSMDLVGLH